MEIGTIQAGGDIELSEDHATDHSSITKISNSDQTVEWSLVEQSLLEFGVSDDDCKKIAECVQRALRPDSSPTALEEAGDFIDDVTKNSATFNIPARILMRLLKKLFGKQGGI